MQTLLDHLKTIPVVGKQEPNLFSAGARGHYENPVSDVLAFFIDPGAGHGLDMLVLEAVLSCLPDDEPPAPLLISSPEREIRTASGNRIDILLESDKWVMVIENKIWHQQNNPFNDYRAHLRNTRYQSKKQICVVLSPEGYAPSGWTGISYRRLIDEVNSRTGTAFVSSPLNKWLILLREYILHLETLMGKYELPADTEAFVLENLYDIQEMVLLKNNVVKSLQQECQRYLTEQFSDKEYEVNSVLHHWNGYPAIRFAFSHWLTPSDVVLFLNSVPGDPFEVRSYACDLTSEALRTSAKAALCVDGCDNYWDEGKGKIIGFTTRLPRSQTDKNHLFAEVARRMALLDLFEKTHHSA